MTAPSGPTPRRAPHPAQRRRRAGLFIVPLCALILTSCAGADQQGSAAHRLAVWVSGTGLGQDIATLKADNARVPKDVANGAGAMHAACQTLQNDAQMANGVLPSPDADVTRLLTEAYNLEGTSGTQCYNAGSTNPTLLRSSERDAIRAEALYSEALQRIAAVDGKVVSTTTIPGNSGDSGGGILG